MTKQIWKSKTLWLNLVGLLDFVFNASGLDPVMKASVLTAANAVLRIFFTDSSLSFKTPPAPVWIGLILGLSMLTGTAQAQFKAMPTVVVPPMGINTKTGGVDFEVSGGPGVTLGSWNKAANGYDYSFSPFITLGGNTNSQVTFSAGLVASVYIDWIVIGWKHEFTLKNDYFLVGYKYDITL